MFDLEQSIAEWRRQMLAAGIKTPVPLEELESHLREDIERQTKSGLNQQNAFNSAAQKHRPSPRLKREFKKIGKTYGNTVRSWKFGRWRHSGSAAFVGGIVLKRASFIDMTAAEELSSLAALAAFSLLAWSGRLGHQFLPVIQNRRIRDAILYSVLRAADAVVDCLSRLHRAAPRFHDGRISGGIHLGVLRRWELALV